MKLSTFILVLGSMLLGAALSVGGFVIWSQDQEINALEFRLSLVETHVGVLQSQQNLDHESLRSAVRTTNRNFKTLGKKESDLEVLVDIIGKLILSETDHDPTHYTWTLNNGL